MKSTVFVRREQSGQRRFCANFMPTRSQFDTLVANAYQHLYDFVRLRTDPLADLLIMDASLSLKEKGLRLHRTLLQAVDELQPGAEVALYSKPWRRHRLMMLRYSDAMSPQAVADELSISLRQFYREHSEALSAVTEALWTIYQQREPSDAGAGPTAPDPDLSGDLLEREASRATSGSAYSDLTRALPDALALLHDLMQQRGITTLQPPMTHNLPPVAVDRGLLRQLLLTLFGLVIEAASADAIQTEIVSTEATIRLQITCPCQPVISDIFAGQWTALETLAAICHAETGIEQSAGVVQLALTLPVFEPGIVLLVDDNEDALALYQRFLSANTYHPITLSDARRVVPLARELQPYAIVLDVMMPEQDGWDVLQMLATQAETRHIPVIICSVLKQQTLALSLGASAFLEKPVTEQALIRTLNALKPRVRA